MDDETDNKQVAIARKTAPTRYHRGDATALIDSNGGIESILDRHSQGETLASIADSLSVPYRTLNDYIGRFALPSAIAHARECYAEAWAERGWMALQQNGEELTSASVNRARNVENHCRWRAGIASSRYSEKQQVELTGANGGPIQSQVLVYVPANGRDEKIIESD